MSTHSAPDLSNSLPNPIEERKQTDNFATVLRVVILRGPSRLIGQPSGLRPADSQGLALNNNSIAPPIHPEDQLGTSRSFNS